jgi:hypothetical protein
MSHSATHIFNPIFMGSGSLRVVSEVSLLGVLLDRRERLVGGDLHLGTALLGDLDDEVEHPIGRAQRHVVPRRHLLSPAVDEEHAVVERLGLALLLGLELDGLEERGGGERPALEADGGREAGAGPEARARQERKAGRRSRGRRGHRCHRAGSRGRRGWWTGRERRRPLDCR